MKIDIKRKVQCFELNCPFFETRCLKFLGEDCARYGGNKIPLFSAGYKVLEAKPTKVKTYFGQIDGWVVENVLGIEE